MRTTLSALVTLLLLLAYAALISTTPSPREGELTFQSQWDRNRSVVENFRKENQPTSKIYVGSSLTARLDGQLEADCGFNLSLSGGAILTGLKILTDSEFTPKWVYIETNFPERRKDDEIVNLAKRRMMADLEIFLTENKPINRILSFLKQMKPSTSSGSDFNQKAQEIGLNIQNQTYDGTIDPELLNNRMLEIERYVLELKQRGAEVVFFEMPVHPELEMKPRAQQVRKEFFDRFPDHIHITYQSLASDANIKTGDGLHLLREEAAPVALALQEHRGCPVRAGQIQR